MRRARGVTTLPQDCSTAPYTEDDEGLPAATLDHDGVMEFFQGEFGFDANETVALLGAHTLGRASSANSGFNGAWISGQTSQFNNEYYKVGRLDAVTLSPDRNCPTPP